MKKITDLYEARNAKIYSQFRAGVRQKVLAKNYDLSESRIKAIIAEQNEKMLAKRIYDNLLWIREGLRAAGKDTTEIDAKIEAMREELRLNPVAKKLAQSSAMK